MAEERLEKVLGLSRRIFKLEEELKELRLELGRLVQNGVLRPVRVDHVKPLVDGGRRKPTTPTGVDLVYRIVAGSTNGIKPRDAHAVLKDQGFDQQKVYSSLYWLREKGRIKRTPKGFWKVVD